MGEGRRLGWGGPLGDEEAGGLGSTALVLFGREALQRMDGQCKITKRRGWKTVLPCVSTPASQQNLCEASE